MIRLGTPGGAPPGSRPTCPKCGSDTIQTIEVPWYAELEYLSCDKCQYVWTVPRAQRKSK